MYRNLASMRAVAVLLALAACIAQGQDGVPSTVSRVKSRQKFGLEDMQRDLFSVTPVTQKDGVTVRQLTEKEMPVLSTMLPLEQVQLRLIDMQPCSANVPMVAPRHAVFNFGLGGTTSVGVIQNGQGKVLNTVQKEQSTFFPQGMVFYEANLDCQPSRILQALSSVKDKDIFPESQLAGASAAAIADQFKIPAQQAAALKNAAQANAGANPLNNLLNECRSKCAGVGNQNKNNNQNDKNKSPEPAKKDQNTKDKGSKVKENGKGKAQAQNDAKGNGGKNGNKNNKNNKNNKSNDKKN